METGKRFLYNCLISTGVADKLKCKK